MEKSGKREETLGKNLEKEGKSGRKGHYREGSFTLTLLTNRAGYATDGHPFLACTDFNLLQDLSEHHEMLLHSLFHIFGHECIGEKSLSQVHLHCGTYS